MTKTVAFDLDETLIATDCAEDWLAYAVAIGLPRAQEAREECLISHGILCKRQFRYERLYKELV